MAADEAGIADEFSKDSSAGRWRAYAEAAVAGFFAVYVVLRIVRLDLTNDEYGALLSVYREGFLSCLRFDNVDAQNHFLSSMLSIAFLQLLPIGEVISIRLVSLLGFGLYLYGTWRISRMAPSAVLGVLAFTAFSCNAFLLDFFGLSRGYGLALGLLALSLLWILEWVRSNAPEQGQSRLAKLAVAAAALALLTNLAYLNYYLSLAAVVLFLAFRALPVDRTVAQRLRDVLRDHRYLLYATFLLAAFYVHRVLLLWIYELLYFGGNQGFVADTVGSLVTKTLYELSLPEGLSSTLAWAVAAGVAGCGLFAASAPPEGAGRREARLVAGLLLLMTVYALGLFYTLGVKFIVERTALMFVPLAVALLQCTAMGLDSTRARFPMAALGFYVLLGCSQLNLTHTLTWKANAQTRELVRALPALRAADEPELMIGVSDEVKTILWYYIEKELGLENRTELQDNRFLRGFDWLTIYSLTYNVPDDQSYHFLYDTDLLFLAPADTGRTFGQRLETVQSFPVSGARLERILGPAGR